MAAPAASQIGSLSGLYRQGDRRRCPDENGERIDDLAQLAGGSPGAVAWQLAAALPDVVDAVSPGGQVIDAVRLGREIEEAIAADDRSAGVFGY